MPSGVRRIRQKIIKNNSKTKSRISKVVKDKIKTVEDSIELCEKTNADFVTASKLKVNNNETTLALASDDKSFSSLKKLSVSDLILNAIKNEYGYKNMIEI